MSFDVTSKLIVQMQALGADSVSSQLDKIGRQTTNLKDLAAQAGGQFGQTAKQLNLVGVSAAQTNAAMRQMPAQITDIVTSLQGGQAPLTVLLQQGGQIKDSFGGVGNALRALASMITPTALAIGGLGLVVGGVGAAFVIGAQESREFADAVALTGNSAGIVEAQFNAMGTSIGQRTKAGVGVAREALQALVASGKLMGPAFDATAGAAAAMARATGESAGKVAERFAGMADDVGSSARKLNEQYNFLTEAQYRQIKAMEEAGDKGGALALTMRELEARANTTVQNLGYLESAWKSVTLAVGGYWDALKSLGRADTTQGQADDLRAELARRKQRGPLNDIPGIVAAYERGNAALEKQIELLSKSSFLEAERATNAGLYRQQQQAAIKWIDEGNKYLSKQQQMERELKQLRVEAALAGKSQNDPELLKRLDFVRDKYKETAKAAHSSADAFAAERDAAKEWARVMERGDSLLRDATAETDHLNKAQAEMVRYLTSPAYATNSEAMRKMAIDRLIAASNAEEQAKAEKELARVQAESAKAYKSYLAGFERSAQAAEDAVRAAEDEAQAAGISKAAHVSLAEAVAMVTIERLKEKQVASMGNEDAVLLIQREIDARQKLVGLIRQRDEREAIAAAAKEWEDQFKRTSDQINGTLTDAIVGAFEDGGKDAAKRFGDVVKRMFADMVLRPTIQAALQPVAGALASLLTGGQGAGGGGAAGSMNGLNSLSSLYGAGKTGYGWLTGSSATAAAPAFTSSAATAPMAEYAGTTAATGGGAASAIPIIGWIVAALMASNAAYKGGNTIDMIGDNAKDLGVGAFETHKYETLSKLGFSDKWAQILSGAPIAARLFGHKASSSGYGIGSVSQGDFVSDNITPFQYGDNTLGTGRNTDLEGLSSDVIAQLALTASKFGGKLQEGLRVGTFTDRDREGKVSALLGYFGSQNTLVAGTQTGTGAFGVGGPTAGGVKIEGEEFQAWVAKQMPLLIVQGLQQSDLDARFKEYFDSLGSGSELTADAAQAALNTAAAVQQLTTAFQPLGGAFTQFGTLSVEAFKKLADADGAFNSLTQGVQAYYQAYYSEAERTQIAADGVTKALADVGLTMPDLTAGSEAAHAQFRALVDAQDLSTEAGRKAFTQLMGVSGAFDQVAQAAEAAAQAERERVKKINDTTQSLQLELLQAQGDKTGALALQRQIELASLTALEVETKAAAGTFTNLKLQVYAASDAAQLAADNMAKLKSLASGIDSVVGGFLSGGALQGYFADRILQTLGEAGITGTRAGVIASTKTEILALWDAVGVDGKQAILTALPMWEQLQDQVLKTSGTANSMSDLLAAYNEINPAAETLVDKWRKSRQEMELLQQALDDIDGKPAATKLGQLQAMVSQRNSLAGIQDNLIGLIGDARMAKGGQSAVDYARANEQGAQAAFLASNDPAAAQQWIAWTQKRVQAEAQMRAKAEQDVFDQQYADARELYDIAKQTDTLLTQQQKAQRDAAQEQIDSLTKMQDLAKQLPEILGGIRAGDLSVLSVTGRLGERQKLFDRSLATGNDPAGALQALLQQAQSIYGNTSQYGAIYNKAMADFEAKVTQGAIDADSLLPAAVRQVNELQKLTDKAVPELQKAVVDSSDEMISALTGINTSITGGLSTLTTDIRTMFTLAQTEVDAYQALIEKYVAPYLVPGEIGPDGTKWTGGGSGGGYGGEPMQLDWAPFDEGFSGALSTQTKALETKLDVLAEKLDGVQEQLKTNDARTALLAAEVVGIRKERSEDAGRAQGSLDKLAREANRPQERALT